jgi:putative FmdB family regulatory protein
MPIYEYVCGACNKKTEVIQRVNEPKLRVCPHCGGRLKKAISAPAIQFKGSGFYITDYARARQEGGKAPGGEKSEGGTPEKTEKTEKAGKTDKVEKKKEKKSAD